MWHVLLGFYTILVLISAVAFPFLPESPKYLYVVKKDYSFAIKRKFYSYQFIASTALLFVYFIVQF